MGLQVRILPREQKKSKIKNQKAKIKRQKAKGKKQKKMATKTKTPPTYGDNLPITGYQIKEIRKNCNFQEDIKEEWVQWVTGDVNQTSLKSLTQSQAVRILKAQTGQEMPKNDNWGLFDKNNKQHLTILAQMRTAQWTVPNEKYGEIPDLERLSDFLKSDKSPVKKPLKQMEFFELSKIIEALKGIVKSKYK